MPAKLNNIYSFIARHVYTEREKCRGLVKYIWKGVCSPHRSGEKTAFESLKFNLSSGR